MELKDKLLQSPHLKHLRFVKDTHEYFYCDRPVFNMKYAEKWNGVTSLLSKYENPFDEQKMSKYVAFRDGKAQEEVLAEWAERRDESIAYGNLVHDSADEMVSTGVINPEVEDELIRINELLDLYGLIPIVGEYLIDIPEIKRASSVDLICQVKGTNNLTVVDYKTPRDGLKYDAYKNQKMLYPLGNLEDSKYVRYSLQVEIYKRRLRQLGFDVTEDSYLLVINKEVAEMHMTANYTNEVEKLIQYEKHEK